MSAENFEDDVNNFMLHRSKFNSKKYNRVPQTSNHGMIMELERMKSLDNVPVSNKYASHENKYKNIILKRRQ